MSEKRAAVVMVGAFPPPVHGMAMVNAAVRKEMVEAGNEPIVINIAAFSLDRSIGARLSRLPRVIRGLIKLLMGAGLNGNTMYMSVSGGFGQLYELLFALVARLRGMHIYLHHHTASYLDRTHFITVLLLAAAGPHAVHIIQSSGLAGKVQGLYGARNVVLVSNAIFLVAEDDLQPSQQRQNLKVLGFLSNISAEKGVFEFLELMEAIEHRGLPVEGKLAGPFQDEDVERRVRERLLHVSRVEYEGPVYGIQKSAFYASLDAFIFPTRYANEAEPLVLHEAMMHAVPVIAYGRGAIPEIVQDHAGLVVEKGDPFVPAAFDQVSMWISDPDSFKRSSQSALESFAEKRAESQARWTQLLEEILGGGRR